MSLRKATRLAVHERDGYRCRYCGKPVLVLREYHPWAKRWVGLIHVDHVVPRCIGGGDDIDNLVTACRGCNLEKYDQIWEPIPLDEMPWPFYETAHVYAG